MTVRTFIGLGGNQGDVAMTFQSAIFAIDALPQTVVTAASSLYASPAWGGVMQDDFINAVLEIQTMLPPEALLEGLLVIERNHGRERSETPRWGPRTLDCDILLYGDYQIDSGYLTVPHAHLAERAFVLLPLAELDENLTVPGLGALMPLIERISDQPIRRIAEGTLHVHQSR